MVDSLLVVAAISELKVFQFSALEHLRTESGYVNDDTLNSYNFLALQV